MENQNLINSINVLSEKLMKNIDEKAYELLDSIICIDENILKVEPLKLLLKSNNVELIQILAKSIMMICILCFIAKQLMCIYNGTSCENVFLFLTKVLVITICALNSYWICELILKLFGLITESVDKIIEIMIKKQATFVNLKDVIESIDDLVKNDFLSINGLIKGMLSFGIINILINFSVRYVKIIFLILVSPFCFVFLASDTTKGIFDSWCKLLIANLSLQIFMKFIILIPLAVDNRKNVMFKIILLGTLYIIFKLNDFINYIMSNISLINTSKER